MQETFTEFTFDAAHKTTPQTPLHGHTFRARVYLTGPRHPVFGWSHDLLPVHSAIEEIKAKLDHCLLNDIPGLENPTLENTTRWIYEHVCQAIPGVDRVTLERGGPGHAEGCTCGAAR